MTEISDSQIIQKYIALRDVIADEGKAFSEGDPKSDELANMLLDGDTTCVQPIVDILRRRAAGTKPLEEAMQLLEGFMSIRLRERGDESVRTEHGTAYTSRTMSVRTADKEVLFNHVRESDNFALLAGNLSKDAVKEYIDEHQGASPPGVDVTTITKTLFRRP